MQWKNYLLLLRPQRKLFSAACFMTVSSVSCLCTGLLCTSRCGLRRLSLLSSSFLCSSLASSCSPSPTFSATTFGAASARGPIPTVAAAVLYPRELHPLTIPSLHSSRWTCPLPTRRPWRCTGSLFAPSNLPPTEAYKLPPCMTSRLVTISGSRQCNFRSSATQGRIELSPCNIVCKVSSRKTRESYSCMIYDVDVRGRDIVLVGKNEASRNSDPPKRSHILYIKFHHAGIHSVFAGTSSRQHYSARIAIASKAEAGRFTM